MTSYCEVCRGLFDMPHHHCQEQHQRHDCRSGSGVRDNTYEAAPSIRTSLTPPAAHQRRHGSSSRCSSPAFAARRGSSSSSPAFAVGRRCSSSSQRLHRSAQRQASPSSSSQVSLAAVQESASRRRTPSLPCAAAAERDTVSSLLRMGPAACASELVRTPSRCRLSQQQSRGTRSSRRCVRSRNHDDTIHGDIDDTTGHHHHQHRRRRQKQQSQHREEMLSSGSGGAADAHMAQRLEGLQETLERIREAVRRDTNTDIQNRPAVNAADLPRPVDDDDDDDDGGGGGDSVSGEAFLAAPWRRGSSGAEEASPGRTPYTPAGDAAAATVDAVLAADNIDALPWIRGLSFATAQSTPPSVAAAAAAAAAAPETVKLRTDSRHGGFVPPPPPSSSLLRHDRDYTSRQCVPLSSAGPPPAGAHAAGTQTSDFQTLTSPEGEIFQSPSSVSPSGGKNNNDSSSSSIGIAAHARHDTTAPLVHIETLRGGFVELCGAVREDLHALHARVNDLQKQQQYQEQQQQQLLSKSLLRQQGAGIQDKAADTLEQPSIAHDKLLAELQQYTVSMVHKVLQQQQQQMGRVVSAGGAGTVSTEPVPFASALSSPRYANPTGDVYGLSPEALDAHIRSAVRCILHEDEFRREVEGMFAQQQGLRRDMKTSRREWGRRCDALEEQIALLAGAVQSTQLDVEELRIQPVSPPPPQALPAATSAAVETAAPPPVPVMPLTGAGESFISPRTSKAAVAAMAPEVWEDRLLQRVRRLLVGVEERCVQRVRGEVMQPLLEHVRRLMSAHQAMIDTVVENRCAQFEAYVDRGRHGWEQQVTELRTRLNSLRGDVHSALRNLSENLNVACPGPLCCQRRDQSGLEKLMQDRSDPYLLPIQELDIPRIAAIALEEGKELQHLWDGLTALNATLRMQVEDGAATKEDLDAALRLYAEVMRHAPTTIAAAAGAEGAGSGGDAIPKSLSEDEWRREWEEPLREFRIIVRAGGDTRIP